MLIKSGPWTPFLWPTYFKKQGQSPNVLRQYFYISRHLKNKNVLETVGHQNFEIIFRLRISNFLRVQNNWYVRACWIETENTMVEFRMWIILQHKWFLINQRWFWRDLDTFWKIDGGWWNLGIWGRSIFWIFEIFNHYGTPHNTDSHPCTRPILMC